jgi:hypothetical protein
MKAKFCLAFASVLVFSVLARAQTSMPGGGNFLSYGSSYNQPYPFSSTAGEGYARGIGEVIRAKGEYNLATSAAAVNFSEARRRQIENDKQWLQTYFETRDINRQARDAELKRQRGTPEDLVRYARAGRPKLLSNGELDTVTGEIHWPILLRAEEFGPQRAQLEKAFADRAYHGVMGAEVFLKATQATNKMLASLKSQIHNMPPQQFMEATRFVQSLAYEASQPAA